MNIDISANKRTPAASIYEYIDHLTSSGSVPIITKPTRVTDKTSTTIDHIQWRIQKILVGGDFKHKTAKIRMSSPKLRVVFWPKSEIQTIFSPKIRCSPKKKKKVFTKIESDFSAEIGNSNDFFA